MKPDNQHVQPRNGSGWETFLPAHTLTETTQSSALYCAHIGL